jgi:hypothetical protein
MKARWRHSSRAGGGATAGAVDRDRAIGVSAFERDAHLAIGPLLESVLREWAWARLDQRSVMAP